MQLADQPFGRVHILKIQHLAGDAKREAGPRQRGKMALPRCLVTRAGGIGTEPSARRMAKRGDKLAIACILIGGGKRLVDKVSVNGMFLQAAADGQRRAPATTLAAGLGKRKGGVIDIAKPGAIIDHHLDGARHLGLVM